MSITLNEAKNNDGLVNGIIDEFRKNNFLLGNMPFDDCVTASRTGCALTYNYYRVTNPAKAVFRALGSEFNNQTITKQKMSVDLKVFGGAFDMDRISAKSNELVDEIEFQSRQMIKAVGSLFNDTVINGDISADSKAFDGLEKALTGSSTEFNTGTAIDLSTSATVDSNYKTFLDKLDEFILSLDGTPSALLGNTALIAKIRACARRANSCCSESVDDFGRPVLTYNGIPLVDLGYKSGTTTPVAPVASGATNLYAVRFGTDAFHAVTLAEQSPVKIYLPDFSVSGAVKKGEIEIVTAVALKNTTSAGVFRKIKVA